MVNGPRVVARNRFATVPDIEHMYYQQMKRCPRCGRTKSLTDFHRTRLRRDGRQPYCKACRAEIDHAIYMRRRAAGVERRPPERSSYHWILSLKAGRPCADCGTAYAPQAMQWDHRPGTLKLGTISGDLRGRDQQVILDEIAKCDLVCANCHSARTEARRDRHPHDGPKGIRRRRHAIDVVAAPSSPELLRPCAKCRELKPPAAFHRSRTGQFSYCIKCRREYDRRYYAERGRAPRLERHRTRMSRERDWLQELKAGRPCADCKLIFPAYAMQWDHLPDKVKIDDISRMVGRSRAVVISEIQKCELVCANCHAIRTARRATKRYATGFPLITVDRERVQETIGVYRLRIVRTPVGVAGLEPAKSSCSQSRRSTN